MRRRQALEATNFLGLHEKAKTKNLPQFMRGGKNFLMTDDGYIEKSWGTKKIYEGHSFDEIYSLFWHKEANSVLLATGLEGSDYKMKVCESGTWTEKSLPASVGSKHFDKYPVSYISFLNEPYFFTGNMALYYKSASTKDIADLDDVNKTWFLANGGDEELYIPVRGIAPVIHFNALWIAGIGEWRNTVLFSKSFTNIFYDIGTGALPDLNWRSVGGDDTASGATSDEITTMAEWTPDLIIFKNQSLHRMVGMSSLQYRAIPISEDIGSEVPQSVQRTRAGIIFMHNPTSGIWKYTGGAPINISRPRVDDILGQMGPKEFVRSGVYKDRYYVLSLGRETLVYDMDLDAWGKRDDNFGAFSWIGGLSSVFIAADNQYKETTTAITDPARPGETQDVLIKTPTSSDIIEFNRSGMRRLESDGTGGEDFEIEMITPYLDAGSKSQEKTWYEVAVHYKCAEAVLAVDAEIDGALFENLQTSIDPRPLYNQAYYGVDEYERIPIYQTMFKLPMASTGYMISLRFYTTTGDPFRLENYTVYFLPRGFYKEERE